MSKDEKTIPDSEETVCEDRETACDVGETVSDSVGMVPSPNETVSDSVETVSDTVETLPDADGTDATSPDDSGATISDSATISGDATVLDGEEVSDAKGTDTEAEDIDSSNAGAAVPEATDGANDKPILKKGASLLDTYHIESNAIEGGMGAVWRVHHTGWNVDLAMKRPKSGLFQTQSQKDNFIRECKAWINLGLHPNIVSCYYVREISGTPSIFSEWMDGGSLKNAIEDGRLYEGNASKRILDIAIQFARGLHYAHEYRDGNGNPKGLIHQDVKPDNLLLTKEWDAKVADFGIARARATLTLPDANIPTDATMFSASGGYTPAYCSMEQMSGEQLTRRTDVYSWAVSVMEMYLGDRPWQSGVIAGAACEEYFPDARVPIPEKMKGLLRECLRAKEAQRPHDFTSVENRLLEIYREEVGADYPRPVSKAAADTADSLNNRALSFLDLGMPEEAERYWKQALEFAPGHLHSIYNQCIYLWRNGSIDDRESARRIAVVDKEAAVRIDSEGIILTPVYDFLSAFEKSYTRYFDAMQLVSVDDRLFCLIGHESGTVYCTDVISKKTIWNVMCHKSREYMNYSGKCGITGIEISPDKLYLYSYGPDGLINKIDIRTGTLEASADISKIHNESNYSCFGVSALSISFNGEQIACISDLDMDDSPLFVLNADTLKPVKILKNRNAKLTSVGFLPKGQLITGSQNSEISYWETKHGLVRSIISDAGIAGIKVLSDGNVLVCDSLGHIVFMDASGRIKKKFAGAYGPYREINISDNGIAVASFDHIILFDTHTDGCAKILPGSKPAITREGRYLVTNDGVVYALTHGKKADYMLCAVKSFDESTELDRRFQAALKAGYDALNRFDISQAQNQLSVARALKGEDIECIRLNDAIGVHGKRTGIRAINHVGKKLEHPYAITDVGINHAKDTLLCLSGGNQLHLYTIEGELKKSFQDMETELHSAYFSINDETLVCLGTEAALFIDVSTNEIRKLKKDYTYITTDLRYGIVREKDAGSYSLYDLEKNIAINTLYDIGKHVLRTAEENHKIYMFCTDRIGAVDTFISDIAVISLNTLQLEQRYCFSQNTNYRTNTAFSVHNLYCVDRKGRFFGGKVYKNQPAILSCNDFTESGGKLYPTDISLVAKFDKNPATISDTAFSDDGNFLYTADTDGMLKIYSGVNRSCVKELNAHTGEIKRAVSDGSLIITGGQDGMLKLWNVVWEYTF